MATLFTVRIRAYAAAHFEWDDVLAVSWLDAEAKFQSEYTGGDNGRAYAVTIHGEIRGEGESLEEAEPRLGATITVLDLSGFGMRAAYGSTAASLSTSR